MESARLASYAQHGSHDGTGEAESVGHSLGRILRISVLSFVGLVVLVLLFIYVFIPGFIAVAGILSA
jgi:hypothetical protein